MGDPDFLITRNRRLSLIWAVCMMQDSGPTSVPQRNARLFIILFVRNFGGFCSQFCLSVRNSVWGPFNRNSRGNPLLCWLGGGGVNWCKNCEQKICEQSGVSYYHKERVWRRFRAELFGAIWLKTLTLMNNALRFANLRIREKPVLKRRVRAPPSLPEFSGTFGVPQKGSAEGFAKL